MVKEFLQELGIFKGFSDEEMDSLVAYIGKKEFKKGDVIYRENTERNYLFLIYSGVVQLYRQDAFGHEQIISAYNKGETFGEGALMDRYLHSTNARAIEDTVLFTLSRGNFFSFVEKHPQLGMRIIGLITRIISRRLRKTTNQMVSVAAQYLSGETRVEHDLLGERNVPYESYFGVQTLRASENFNITGVAINHYPNIILALAQVKQACAMANYDEGLMDKGICDAICQACVEISNGRYHIHFVVDLIQGGAGTSTNMNANEVIANRALEIMGFERGHYEIVHPNNHVNLSQSTNDVYPTALKLAMIYENNMLTKALKELILSIRAKAIEFADVIKMGRTQLQDAVPMTLGQEFEAFAVTLEDEVRKLETNKSLLYEINLGGTAIGTGINATKDYGKKSINHLADITGLPLIRAENLVESTQDTGPFVSYSSAIRRLAIKLSKICNDLRLLSSGPRAGFNEINLPPMQPGSSIMPGKVNPVIPEVVNQVAYKVIGNDLTIVMAAEAGQLQLNVMEPVIAQSLFESISMLINAMRTLKYRCIDGITANVENCRRSVTNSLSIVTALNPILGYEKSSYIATKAVKTGMSIQEIVLSENLLDQATLDRIFSDDNLLGRSI